MGCDIHAYIETGFKTREDEVYWSPWAKLSLDRNYALFGALAGVRLDDIPHPEPKGVPDDLGYVARAEYWLTVNDEFAAAHINEDSDSYRYATAEQASRYVTQYASPYVAPKEVNGHAFDAKVADPDWHTASWLCLEELGGVQVALESYIGKPYAELRAVIAAMRELDGYVRLVFWFDN